MFNPWVQVMFKYAEKSSWMYVTIRASQYKDMLEGKPFEGLMFQYICTESWIEESEDGTENQVGMVYNTFMKEWSLEQIN